MAKEQSPVVLELAPLPREQIGPFLLLGLEKDAGSELIEANWAQRVIWARKNQVNVALEEVNWAREVVNDAEKRVRADAGSLNLDTIDGTLRQLEAQYGGNQRLLWQPKDVERPLADYTLPVEAPSLDEVRQAIAVPDVPADLPGVAWLLEQLSQEPLDPWKVALPSTPSEDVNHD